MCKGIYLWSSLRAFIFWEDPQVSELAKDELGPSFKWLRDPEYLEACLESFGIRVIQW